MLATSTTEIERSKPTPMEGLNTVRKAILTTAGLTLSTLASVTPAAITPATAAGTGQPNIVLLVTDDQPRGMLDAMPQLTAQVRDQGVGFPNGMVPTSLCCPSRSSLLTGNYAHTTGVYTNDPLVHGAWDEFHKQAESSTLATHLKSAGYRTALVGKYLNGWADGGAQLPVGWDYFASFAQTDRGTNGAYFDYTLGGTIPSERHNHAPADYSTDVIGDHAVQVIESTPADQPLFLYVAPFGAHSPYDVAPRDEGTWPLEPPVPAANEDDVSDKPAWAAQLPKTDVLAQRHIATAQHEILMSVDDQVSRIITALGPARAADTLFVMMSDNGFMLGAHRMIGKDLPYARATEVPMMMRWDGHITPASTSDRIMLNIDLTATIAEAAGASWPMEGQPFNGPDRTGTVLEQVKYDGHPAYCGYRTERYLFVKYSGSQGREFYDYAKDPWELHNRASKDAYAARVAEYRQLAMQACSPTPPGFTWSATGRR